MAGGWCLEISITPVQWFLARARRTRDLWGGSYLLSWLAAYAIAGAEKEGAKLLRPKLPDNELVELARNAQHGSTLPHSGSVPNHLLFEVDGEEQARRVAEASREQMVRAWGEIYERVWEEFIKKPAEQGNDTRGIWKRQVESFWEFSWVAYPAQAEHKPVMARRKLWRTHIWEDEPGDKCLVLPELQELSGYSSYTHGEQQRRFWEGFREHLKGEGLAWPFELSWGGEESAPPKEKVCAITAVKRLFGMLGEFKGAEARNWPSTAYMAALPWVELAIERAPQEAEAFVDFVVDAVNKRCQEGGVGDDCRYLVLTEKPSEWLNINFLSGSHEEKLWKKFGSLDGNLFFLRSFSSPEVKGLLGEQRAKEAARKLQDIYSRLEEALKDTSEDNLHWHWAKPSPYYAFLLADGDRLGMLVKRLGPEEVGEALASFGERTEEIVRGCHGRLIYCGGDDVLAIMPMTRALECADKLRKAFEEKFREVEGKATLSAAVVFANMRVPIGGVLDCARRLLEEQAKEASGRNSLAVGVIRRGGMSAMWVRSWNEDPARLLEEIAAAFREGELATSGVYRLRQLLWSLSEQGWYPGDKLELFEEMDEEKAGKLMVAELGGERPLDGELARSVLKAVLEVEGAPRVVVDPLLIGMFLGKPPLEEG